MRESREDLLAAGVQVAQTHMQEKRARGVKRVDVSWRNTMLHQWKLQNPAATPADVIRETQALIARWSALSLEVGAQQLNIPIGLPPLGRYSNMCTETNTRNITYTHVTHMCTSTPTYRQTCCHRDTETHRHIRNTAARIVSFVHYVEELLAENRDISGDGKPIGIARSLLP